MPRRKWEADGCGQVGGRQKLCFLGVTQLQGEREGWGKEREGEREYGYAINVKWRNKNIFLFSKIKN